MNININYLPGFKHIVPDYLGHTLQEKDPWKLLNSFSISSITLRYESFPSKFINLMRNNEEFETLFKVIIISKNNKEEAMLQTHFRNI